MEKACADEGWIKMTPLLELLLLLLQLTEELRQFGIDLLEQEQETVQTPEQAHQVHDSFDLLAQGTLALFHELWTLLADAESKLLPRRGVVKEWLDGKTSETTPQHQKRLRAIDRVEERMQGRHLRARGQRCEIEAPIPRHGEPKRSWESRVFFYKRAILNSCRAAQKDL